MWGWAITFLFLSAIAAGLGFFGLGGLAAVLVRLFLILFLGLLAGAGLLGLMRTEPPA